MTPNPSSPHFIKHEVHEYANENAKKLSELFYMLKRQASQGKWDGISENDFSLTYNTYDGSTEVTAVLQDDNHHSHYFTIQLIPDNGFGNSREDCFRLLYFFEGNFNESAVCIRSFAEYLAAYLHFEGFEPTLIKCNKGISMPCVFELAHEAFCKLIEVTMSHIKPLSWFYTKEPAIESFYEAYYFLAGAMSKLQIESVRGRWDGINPECFKMIKFDEEREAAITLTYRVDSVLKLSICANIAECGDYFDMFCTVNCYPDSHLSPAVREQLDTLFADFLNTLKTAQGNIYVGGGYRKDHSIAIQYFYIEDTSDIFCEMLDEIVPALHDFNFKLPLHPANLTEEMEAVKSQLETYLNAPLEVITEEQSINEKLNHGYFER